MATLYPSVNDNDVSLLRKLVNNTAELADAEAGDVTSVNGRTGAVTLTSADVGLGNVDNTSDANKPVSTATQTALDGKASTGLVASSGLTMNTARLLGRTTASSGAIEELTVGSSLSLSAGSLNAIQDIRVAASPEFAALTLTGNGILNTRFLVGNGTNNNIDLLAMAFNMGATVALTLTTTNATVSGSLTTSAPAAGVAGAWKLGSAASVSPTAPNRTLQVDIGGTVYYIAAKTTND